MSSWSAKTIDEQPFMEVWLHITEGSYAIYPYWKIIPSSIEDLTGCVELHEEVKERTFREV